MIFTSTYETISSFLLITIVLFSAIAIIYLTHISERLSKLKKDTKEDNTSNRDIITEKIENNHRILSELSMKLEKNKDKKGATQQPMPNHTLVEESIKYTKTSHPHEHERQGAAKISRYP